MNIIGMHNLKPAHGSTRRRKRVGRGNGSAHGTYSTRGQKGQRARTGGGKGLKLLGLKRFVQQTPKKRGFRSQHPAPVSINVSALSVFADGATVSPRTLVQQGLVRNILDGVKVLGDGACERKLTVVGCMVSASAKEKIEKAGGKVVTSNQ